MAPELQRVTLFVVGCVLGYLLGRADAARRRLPPAPPASWQIDNSFDVWDELEDKPPPRKK